MSEIRATTSVSAMSLAPFSVYIGELSQERAENAAK